MTRSILYHDDCFNILPRLPDRCVDLILCDLPYGTTQCKWDTPVDLPSLWQQYKRIAKPNAAIILHAQTPFDKVLGTSNLPMLRYEWIWEKTSPTGHLNAKKMPMKAHENVLVFYDKLPVYNPQKTEGHERKVSNNRLGGTKCYSETFTRTSYDATDRYPRSVLQFPTDKQKCCLHPTQKPIALAEYLIRTYTNENAVVLDNCMGSGTTGVACRKLGRRFIGIEKEGEYFQVAKERIETP